MEVTDEKYEVWIAKLGRESNQTPYRIATMRCHRALLSRILKAVTTASIPVLFIFIAKGKCVAKCVCI
jgi:hypothetical protein